MIKRRVILASGALLAVPALAIPALTAPAVPKSSPAKSDASLVSVCVTVTPKSISVTVNGQPIVGGVSGVPRSCVEV